MLDSHPTVNTYFDAYGAAFEALDPSAIADLFAYPCLIAGASDVTDVTIVPTRQAWLPQLERLTGAYRRIGVRRAEIAEKTVTTLSATLAVVIVHWRLVDGEGQIPYEFDAAYTLADLGAGPRVVAIAHNETPRLLNRLGG